MRTIPGCGIWALATVALLGCADPAPVAGRQDGASSASWNGNWADAPPMTHARAQASATLLPSGKVLVAGGLDWAHPSTQVPTAMATAELFDPASRTWRPTGSMAVARASHGAVLLPSGKVLVAGGHASYTWPPQPGLDSAELFDPESETWALTGSLASPRYCGPAVLLNDGRVLMAGGIDPRQKAIATAELFDPRTGEWSPTGSMRIRRFLPSATRLASGRVLVVGGEESSDFLSATGTAELYDPGTGTWSDATSLDAPILGHSALLLPSGKVLVAGGQEQDPAVFQSAAWLYDEASNTWKETNHMSTMRAWFPMVLLRSGKVVVAAGGFAPPMVGHGSGGGGGPWDEPTCRDDPDVLIGCWQRSIIADVYSPDGETWSPTTSMPHFVMYGASAVLLPDGHVLVAGGRVIMSYSWEDDYCSIRAAQLFRE